MTRLRSGDGLTDCAGLGLTLGLALPLAEGDADTDGDALGEAVSSASEQADRAIRDTAAAPAKARRSVRAE
ncbi:hypothetical protein BCR15_13695 [Tessaracoccus lapidicaptus]|uniref:Uncharacterized protein n=1 Tax=Tessaracoccus lapidicaptus TaxID=1427523 RepID=A0A1C0AQY1_9ACTN|nr:MULTISPECIES: hypothetical protein [Tessaracoccus]OCL36751.1 hypothetical protein BCR15_13695 [Tessaracoccus lapidicaptus]